MQRDSERLSQSLLPLLVSEYNYDPDYANSCLTCQCTGFVTEICCPPREGHTIAHFATIFCAPTSKHIEISSTFTGPRHFSRCNASHHHHQKQHDHYQELSKQTLAHVGCGNGHASISEPHYLSCVKYIFMLNKS